MLRHAWRQVLCYGFVAAALALQQVTGQEVCTIREGGSASLAQCLENPRVTDIVLESNYTLSDNINQAAPVQLNRNVTIRGPTNITPDERPVFDMQFVFGAVQLCSTCIFTLNNLVIKNDLRATGPAYDLFVGKPGSKVRSLNTYRLRIACTAADTQLKLYNSLPRSKLYPKSDTPQGIRLRDIVYKGKVYPDSVWADYSSFDAPLKFDESRGGSQGGYAAMAMNSTRLCEHYVSKECLAVMHADACINQLIDSLQAPARAPSGSSAATTAVAIAVPLVAGFLLAGAAVAWWLRRRHLRLRNASGMEEGMKRPKTPGGPKGPLLAHRSTHRTTGASCSSSEVSAPKGPAGRKPLGRTSGWEVLDSQTASFMGVVQDDRIDLGAFIGAGSFGKVYKGRWNNMDVAVKVIEHSGSSSDAVEQEMQMMMSFQHQNVVKAYHCVHYVHTQEDEMHTQSEVSSVTQSHFNTMSSRCSTGGTPPLTRKSLEAARCAADAGSSAAALAAGTAATTATQRSPPGKRNAAAAAAACSDSTRPGQEASGDAAITIRDAAAPCRYGHPSPCQCCSSTGISSHPAAAAAGGAHRVVHFDAQCSSDEGRIPSQMSSASSTYMTAVSSHAGSATSRGGSGLVLPATDSMGSSIDCRCVAGGGGTANSTNPDILRRSRSMKEASKRFESWLVLEFCDRGCLSNYLAEWPTPGEAAGDESDDDSMLRVLQLLLDTAQGLEELHRHKVVHGDLNARNVLVASCSGAAFGVQGKLADLGLSRSVKQHQTHRTTNTIGTMNHMPPEMLRSGKMSVHADIYALGIMMWELYSGEDAFQRLQHPGQFFETVVLQDLRPVTPTGMPADYQLLMQRCWATQPSARPSSSTVVECLQYMIQQRHQQQLQAAGNEGTAAGAPHSGAALNPMPQLFATGLQQVQGLGSKRRASAPATNGAPAQDGPHPQLRTSAPQQPHLEEDSMPSRDHRQGAEGGRTDASQGASNQLHNLKSLHQPSIVPQAAASNTQQGALREHIGRDGSTGGRDGYAGYGAQLPASVGGLTGATRGDSSELGDASFDRDTSWSGKQGSQTGGLGHTAWFV